MNEFKQKNKIDNLRKGIKLKSKVQNHQKNLKSFVSKNTKYNSNFSRYNNIIQKISHDKSEHKFRKKIKINDSKITQNVSYDSSQFQKFLSLNEENEKNKKIKYYWFATYDKLIKRKKFSKIFSFYNLTSRDSIVYGNQKIINESNKIIEKELEIKNYQIYFIKNINRPFLRKSEGSKIYVKLYLLTKKQFNIILSYLNRIEYDDYITDLDNISTKDNYITIFDNKNTNNKYHNLNYSTIYCLGSYMNIPIFSFSRLSDENYVLYKDLPTELEQYPNSKKVAKLIKLLLLNFPSKTKQYFIDYIFSYYKNMDNNEINDNILNEKKKEINHLLISKKKSLYKLSPENMNNPLKIGAGYCPRPEVSFSSFISSFNYHVNSTSNNNTNNNIKNCINNNLGTISFNASNFDFSSDYLISMRQNEENISKILDSIRSLSNKNQIISNNNAASIRNQTTNSFLNNKQIKTTSDLGDKKKQNLSKISNFSFENDSKKFRNYINIKFNNINNKATKYIKKNVIQNIENYKIPIVKTSIRSNILNKGAKNSAKPYYKYIPFLTDANSSTNNLEENKENFNTVSNFGDIKIDKKSVNQNNDKNKKASTYNILKWKYLYKNPGNSSHASYLRGEDIFQSTKMNEYKRNSKKIFLTKKGIKSFDFNNAEYYK